MKMKAHLLEDFQEDGSIEQNKISADLSSFQGYTDRK